MPEESKESKAKKLAAARKKLKEYQQRGTMPTTTGANSNDSTSNSGHVSSNISERSESDLHLNGSSIEINQTSGTTPQDEENNTPPQLEVVNYFTDVAAPSFGMSSPHNGDDASIYNEGSQNINAIQVLITEKAQLTSELSKFRTTCREKDLELEELRVQHANVSRRVEELQQHLKDQQKQAEQQRTHNAELQHKLAQARSQNEDQSSHLLELQQQMQLREERLKLLDNDFKEKCNELEMAQLRIRQLSDENNITKDNRVETLTQNQFMYEQQIRDLQAMVQQLTQDKEQANLQYQTYVQQLNTQVNQLNERNNELMDECAKLQDREKQMIDHHQQLEKEIQKNLSRQSEIMEEKQKDSSSNATANLKIEELQDRVREFETERYEFQLKIKSQEDRLHTLQNSLQQKEQEVDTLNEHLENITSEQPDKSKLLATMESDKVAASRALSQNVELKKQLDELELRFVQLTNDKADLMNRLDAEQYANREMHSNYGAMEQRLQDIDERFKFKDEEMIRLSHENEELKKKNTELQWRLNGETAQFNKTKENEEIGLDHEHNNGQDYNEHDHEHHGHDHEHHNHDHEHHEHDHDHHGHDHDHHGHDHDHHGHDHGHHGHDHDHHGHDHGHDDDHDNKEKSSSDYDACQEATEVNSTSENVNVTPVSSIIRKTKPNSFSPPHIATEEAVEKLQQRFTQLMGQVADLTEEKQRLEHLVMQLQSETETIGEYIALYQTQRRILKQREYEKAAQTALLQSEREQMRERLTMLNNLVNSLGMEIPITQQQHQLQQQLNEALASQHLDMEDISQQQSQNGIELDSPSIGHSTTLIEQNRDGMSTPAYASTQNVKNLNSLESQQILHRIQNIITEIKENTKELPAQHSVDHLNCCSGKFEVV